MARGDFVGDIISVGASAYVDVAILSGDEVIMKAWGCDSASSGYRLHISDGTGRPRIGTADKMMGLFNGMMGLSIPLDNTNELSFYNGAAGTEYFYYGGYLTKD